MIAGKELFECNKVPEALSHLLSVDGNHIIMHPVMHHLVALTGHSLCDFAFVMRED